MAGGQGGGQGGGAGTMGFLLIIAAICVLFSILWHVQKEAFAHVLYAIRYFEAFFVVYFIESINFLLRLFHLPVIEITQLASWFHGYAQHSTPEVFKNAQFSEFMALSTVLGEAMRYPAILILSFFVYYLKFRHKGNTYTRTFTMKKLCSTEVKLWPYITPVLDENLVKTPLTEGPWAMAQLPLDFSKQHNILHTSKDEKGNIIWDINLSESEGLFSQQMGPLWTGLNNQPLHIQALAIIFISKLQRDSKTERHFIEQIACSSRKGGRLNLVGVKERVAELANSKPLRWLESRHAYRTTLMASLLQMSRSEGVLATAEFLWLKPVDRKMWYMLNSVGRQTACVEVAGPFSHWQTELKVRRPLRTPAVSQAASALKEAVDQILFIGEEESWRTSSVA